MGWIKNRIKSWLPKIYFGLKGSNELKISLSHDHSNLTRLIFKILTTGYLPFVTIIRNLTQKSFLKNKLLIWSGKSPNITPTK